MNAGLLTSLAGQALDLLKLTPFGAAATAAASIAQTVIKLGTSVASTLGEHDAGKLETALADLEAQVAEHRAQVNAALDKAAREGEDDGA